MSDHEQSRSCGPSFTIAEWCQHRRISRGLFYKLIQQGTGPRTYVVGTRRLISTEADAEWLRAREIEQQVIA